MYSKALDPKIMSTMLPPDFPADRLSQPQYRMRVEKDVMIPMRDGVMIAANIYRPDAEGTFPALHAADSYQKDMVGMVPTLPIFHCVEVNDIEYFVSRGYVFVHTDSRGTGHSPEGEWQFWSLEEQTDLYDMIEWIAAQDWCTGKVGMLGESLLAWVQWFAACQQPPHLTCSTTPPTTTSGSSATPTSPRSKCRCSPSERCTKWACTCAGSSAATKK